MVKQRLMRMRNSLGPATGIISSATRTLISYQFISFVLVCYYLNSDAAIVNKIISKLNSIAVLKPIAVYAAAHKIQFLAIIAAIVSSLIGTSVTALSAVQPFLIYVSKDQTDYKEYIPLYFFVTWILRTRSQKLRITALLVALALYIWGWWGVGLL